MRPLGEYFSSLKKEKETNLMGWEGSFQSGFCLGEARVLGRRTEGQGSRGPLLPIAMSQLQRNQSGPGQG